MQADEIRSGEIAEEVQNLLHELYYDSKHPSAYTSIDNVYRAAKKLTSTLKRRDVNEWFQKQLTATLHKPIRLNFPRNKTIVMNIDD